MITTKMSKFITLFCVFSLLGCDLSNRQTADKLFLIPLVDQGTYNLKEPTDKFFLPYVLEEISGLSYVKNGVLACLQDEDGKIFFYDLNKKEITRSVKFANQGDYEGLEVVGDTAYVVQSNGDLFKFSIDEKKVESELIKTPLNKDNDIEGLGYNSNANILILVCKDNSDIGKRKQAGKAAFQFDLSNDQFDTTALFSITKYDMQRFFEVNKNKAYEEKRINFRPSGIAWHPIQDKYYVLAHVGKMLLVVNRQGEIEASYPISPRLLGQPEGICFAPNGDMFISSEGEGDKGYILKFEME